MSCIKCGSEKIISILGHCVDRFNAQFGNREYEGYVPYGLEIGGGDDVQFDYCAECGQIQGKFPIDPECFKDEEEIDDA